MFDPRPAVNPHFSHELFVTLLGASASLRSSWHKICLDSQRDVDSEDGAEQSRAGGRHTGALDVVSTLYCQVVASSSAIFTTLLKNLTYGDVVYIFLTHTFIFACIFILSLFIYSLQFFIVIYLCHHCHFQGREDLMFLHPQWNVPVPGTFPKLSGGMKKKEEADNKKSAAEKMNSEINMIFKSINKSGSSSSGSSSSVDLHASHDFNMGRLHEDICEQFGAEEPGAPREW